MNIKIGVALTAICLGALCAGTAMPAQQAAPSPAELSRLHELASDFGALQRYAAANAALPASQPGRVVFYGDSITDSWAKPPHTFFPGKPYIGRGISGQTTAQMLLRFRQDVIDLHPDAVVTSRSRRSKTISSRWPSWAAPATSVSSSPRCFRQPSTTGVPAANPRQRFASSTSGSHSTALRTTSHISTITARSPMPKAA
jgi:hypothetical protein